MRNDSCQRREAGTRSSSATCWRVVEKMRGCRGADAAAAAADDDDDADEEVTIFIIDGLEFVCSNRLDSVVRTAQMDAESLLNDGRGSGGMTEQDREEADSRIEWSTGF